MHASTQTEMYAIKLDVNRFSMADFTPTNVGKAAF